MAVPFLIKGLNTGTGQIVEIVILAESGPEAKSHAEDCGLRFVLVEPLRPAPPEEATVPPDHHGSG